MADYTHTIDRWDEATGEQIAANFSRTPSLQPRADHHLETIRTARAVLRRDRDHATCR